jgi:hypothetical protein
MPRRATFARRFTVACRFEDLEPRTLLSTGAWDGYASNAQHTALSTVASSSLQSILWQTPVDLDPQYTSDDDLLIHYGSPAITAADTVLVPVKTGATGGFEVQAFSGSTGALKWTLPTDYTLMPANGGSGSGYDWTPSYSPTLTPANNYYFAGNGGTVYETTSPDAAGPSAPAKTQLAFYGLSNYNANPAAYNSSIYINTPITSDAAGDIFFGFLALGSNPLGLTSGIARIGANGTGTYTSVVSGMSQVATNSAPAVSDDGSTVYVLESTGNFGSGKLVALNSQTLAVTGQVTLMDVLHPSNTAVITNDATASPMVGPDGSVYIGVLENPFASNHDRGWLLQFNAGLTKEGIPGDFGWDDTPSVVPASMVPSYKGTSTYLLMTKYNNYAGEGGNGINEVAVLDPNATEVDPSTGATVMKEVLTIAGVTPDPEFPNVPGAVREWCINTAAVDPATDSILVNSEDGYLYRWSLATNSFTQRIKLNNGFGEAYTPTLIGPNGTVYAIGNATLSAVGGAPYISASFVGKDTTTQGNWIGVYGSQGYNVINNAVSYPSYATVTPTGQSAFTQVASTTDPRALQDAPGTGTSRIAAIWQAANSFSVNVNLNDGLTHELSLYLIDWSNIGRVEQVQLANAITGTVMDTETVSSFSGGVYLSWAISGDVSITFTSLNSYNAVVSGLFFGPAPPPPPPPPGPGTATFVGTDIKTQGSWSGVYGSQGYNVINNAVSYPSYATVTPTGQTAFTQVASTTDPRALQDAPGTGSSRIAAIWEAASTFSVNVNLTDGLTHELSLYFIDWNNVGRVEQIQLKSANNGTVLDTEKISSFYGGVYLSWAISGDVLITFTSLNSYNAVVSGLFFGPAPPPPPPPPGPGTATFLGTDTKTQGSWSGLYGSDGYNVINNAVSYPSYATVTPTGETAFTQVASTSDPRALEDAPGTGTSRIAAIWEAASTFSVNVNLTNGLTHELSLYFIDWSNVGRVEQIQLKSANNGTVLDTEKISSFYGGVYLSWAISGDVLITFTSLNSYNAVVSGLFFEPVSTPAVATRASSVVPKALTQSSFASAATTSAITELGALDVNTAGPTASSPTAGAINPIGPLVHDVAIAQVVADKLRALPSVG